MIDKLLLARQNLNITNEKIKILKNQKNYKN